LVSRERGATVIRPEFRTPAWQHTIGRHQDHGVALSQSDGPALERLWSQHFILKGTNNQVVVGRQAVLDTFGRAGIINFSTFEREIEFPATMEPSSSSWASRVFSPSATPRARVCSPGRQSSAGLRMGGKTKRVHGGCLSVTRM
jgi:hypothetical protein